MTIQSRDSRSTARTVRLTDEEGKTRDVCHVTSRIYDGRSITLVVDVHDATALSTQMAAAQAEVMSFISAVFADAQQTGLPVCPMSEAE